MPQSFDDRSSALGQLPTSDPSHFASVAKGGGKDAGGRENTRAGFQWKMGPKPGPVSTGGTKGGFGAQKFTDNKV